MLSNNTRERKIKGDQIEVFKILNGYKILILMVFWKLRQVKITRRHDFTNLPDVI